MANFYTDNKDLKFHLFHPLMEKIVLLKERNFVDKDQYDYAPFGYEDAMDNYEKILEIVGDICANTIEPNAKSVDKDGPVLENNQVKYARGTQENIEAVIKSGVVGVSLPRKYGGLNMPFLPYVIAFEIITRADAGFGNIWGLQDCAETIREFGSEEIKDELLPKFSDGAMAAMILTEPDAGSDLQAVQLKATYDEKKDSWLLNGVKRFITNGDTDISLVLARSEEETVDARGLSLFVYERKDKNVIVRRIEDKLGIKGAPTCELVFKNAPARLIGDRKFGLIKYVMSLMNAARLGIGAQSVGISEAAYREALKYAKERIQFGKAIIEFPQVYEMLSNMKIKLFAVRNLLYETVKFVDLYKLYTYISKERQLEPEERKELKKAQQLANIYTPILKLISSEYCNQITYDAVQIHGGTGYMKEFLVERLYRDARITSIYEGTSQLQVKSAISGVMSGILLNHIREYESRKIMPELDDLKRVLVTMTNEFDLTVKKVNECNEQEYLDYHARRLVEMAGNLIMGYLSLFSTNRDTSYKNSAKVFINNIYSENSGKAFFIDKSEIQDLGLLKECINSQSTK